MNEPELESARQRFTGPAQVLFQQARAGLLLIDPLTERVLDANAMAQRLTEFNRPELLEMALRSLVRHEQPWHDWTLPLLANSKDGEDGFLLRTRQPNRWIPVRLGMTPLPSGENETMLLIRLIDRRENLDLQRRAQKAESDFRRVLGSVSQCVWSCRVEGNGWTYRYLSPAVERLTGRPAGDFLVAPDLWQQVVDPADQSAWRDFRRRLLAGQPGTLEYRLRRGNSSICVRETVVIAPDEGGLVLHGVLDEIPVQSVAEEGVSTRESQTRLDGFAHVLQTLAHDFNNLITGILGHISLARLDASHSSLPEGLAPIESVALRAAELCRRLAICAGQSSSRGSSSDPLVELRRVVATMEPTVPAGQFQIVADAELPAVSVDPVALRRAVEEMLRNATEAGSGKVVVRLRVLRDLSAPVGAKLPHVFSYPATRPTPPSGWLCIEVRDEGPGLTDEARQRLGEPFFTTRPGHRGLGLASILGFARAHEGVVQVHSRLGAGTHVSLALPAFPAVPAVASAAPARPVPTVVAGRPVVLLAEDEPAVMDVVTRLLISAGCEVVSASNGEEAIQRFAPRAGEIRLALIDMTMPRISGEKVARELRRLSAELPIVLMSGYADLERTAQFADLGLAGYLQKPFRLPELLELLKKILGRS